MKNILVVMPFAEAHKSYIEALAPDCRFTYTSIPAVTPEEVQSADIILGNVPPALVREANHLEFLQLNSAGADPYMAPGVIRPGTILTCATGAYGLAVSEGMVAMTMMLVRKMDLYMKNQAAHRWHTEGNITSVWGSTVLVLGLGDIGTAYARSMKGMGATVIGVRRHMGDCPDCVDELYTMDHLEELLPRADIVAMALPSTPATRKLITEERMRLMKPTAYLVNAGRGDAVDCDALDRILREGVIGGAALDVTDPEPLPADHPLWDAPRSIVVPHAAGNFFLNETFERLVRITGENLKNYLAGKTDQMKNVLLK